jgi:hypothetical protein
MGNLKVGISFGSTNCHFISVKKSVLNVSELHRRCIILVYKWLYTLNQFCFLLNSGIRIA